MLFLLLLLSFTIMQVQASEKKPTCEETYIKCTQKLDKEVASWYTWATNRSPCEDVLKFCIFMNKQKTNN